MESCDNCCFYVDHIREGLGQCRRHAPVDHVVPEDAVAPPKWPQVGKNDWCGEWKAAPEDEAVVARIVEALGGMLEGRGYVVADKGGSHMIDELTVEYLAVTALAIIRVGEVEIDDNGNPRMPLAR